MMIPNRRCFPEAGGMCCASKGAERRLRSGDCKSLQKEEVGLYLFKALEDITYNIRQSAQSQRYQGLQLD